MLLDWSKWKNSINFQNDIFKENKIEEKLKPSYINNWEIEIVIGPVKVENKFDFKNLKKNEFKPFIMAELAVLEETPIPKWLKTYYDEEFEVELSQMFDAELINYSDDTYALADEEIKNTYISNKRNLVSS